MLGVPLATKQQDKYKANIRKPPVSSDRLDLTESNKISNIINNNIKVQCSEVKSAANHCKTLLIYITETNRKGNRPQQAAIMSNLGILKMLMLCAYW